MGNSYNPFETASLNINDIRLAAHRAITQLPIVSSIYKWLDSYGDPNRTVEQYLEENLRVFTDPETGEKKLITLTTGEPSLLGGPARAAKIAKNTENGVKTIRLLTKSGKAFVNARNIRNGNVARRFYATKSGNLISIFETASNNRVGTVDLTILDDGSYGIGYIERGSRCPKGVSFLQLGIEAARLYAAKAKKKLVTSRHLLNPWSQVKNINEGFDLELYNPNNLHPSELKGGTVTLIEDQSDVEQLWQAAKNDIIKRAYREGWSEARIKEEVLAAKLSIENLQDIETAFADGKDITESIPYLFDAEGIFRPTQEALEDPYVFESLYGPLYRAGLLDANVPGFYPSVVLRPKKFIPIIAKKRGGKIKIKKANKGKFTDYCGGKVTEECIRKGKNSPSASVRKQATFADNARKWKHLNGGIINYLKLF